MQHYLGTFHTNGLCFKFYMQPFNLILAFYIPLGTLLQDYFIASEFSVLFPTIYAKIHFLTKFIYKV